MRTLYVDAFSGISGNMFIGALLDLGLKSEEFMATLDHMGIDSENIMIKKVQRQGISASYFNLKGEEEKLCMEGDPSLRGKEGCQHKDHSHEGHKEGCQHKHHSHGGHSHSHGENREDPSHGGHSHSHGEKGDHSHGSHSHRTLKDVLAIIDASNFSEPVKNTAKKIYQILAESEAHIHGSSPAEVHFHEVGDLDSIIDCLGASYFFHSLGVDKVVFAPINTGSGVVQCAHGIYPVPTPATTYILSKIQAPIGGAFQEKELTTPTGAAIVAALYDQFQARPQGRVLATGYGAGSRDNALPNVLRVMVLEEEEANLPLWYSCNVDDMTGEELGFLMDRLFEAGARDVSFAPISMKKNRPGHRIDVLGEMGQEETLKRILFQHSSTLGIKKIPLEKFEMSRRTEILGYKGQTIGKKMASYKDIHKESYEYEDLKNLAQSQGWSLAYAQERIRQDYKG